MAGGARPGAGHPTTHRDGVRREAKASAAAVEQEKLHSAYPDMLDAALYLALGKKAVGCLRCQRIIAGCKCVKPDKGMVYEVKPDREMLSKLIDKVGGKPTAAPPTPTDTQITVVPRFERPPLPGAETAAVEEEAGDGPD